jgi:hypothetical protein
MLYLETSPNTFSPWNGAPINDVVYPLSIESIWSEQELAAIDLYAPVDPGVAEGKIATGFTVERVEGVVTKVYVLDDAPPPPFENLSRPAFLFMMGKLGIDKETVYGLIDQMPDGDEKTLARIVFDEQQSFARDNALLATLVAAAGLTTQQVDDAWRIGEGLTW